MSWTEPKAGDFAIRRNVARVVAGLFITGGVWALAAAADASSPGWIAAASVLLLIGIESQLEALILFGILQLRVLSREARK